MLNRITYLQVVRNKMATCALNKNAVKGLFVDHRNTVLSNRYFKWLI